MPRLLGIGTAVPPYQVTQEQAREGARLFFEELVGFDIGSLLTVFENADIRKRHFCVPPEWFLTEHTFAEKNRTYFENARSLTEQAIRTVCGETGVDPGRFAHIFFVSTTGISTPSIDAHVFNRLDFRPTIRRTPIWGLGCAGGVAGLSRAYDWLKGYPSEMALVVAIELCGLTFMHNDLSKSNFVATSLFGDGCAAAILAGDEVPLRTDRMLALEAAGAYTWKNSLDVMGWDIQDKGLKVVFSQNIPNIVARSARPAIEEFLEANGFCLKDIQYLLAHPGGTKVMQAYCEALGLEEHQIESMKETMRQYGNMSSATVYFVLQHFLNSTNYREGVRILSTSLGPGFSTEMIVARCC